MNNDENKHDDLAIELLRLTSTMKQNFTIAGTVIKEDNQTLSAMQLVGERNRQNLEKESKRLEYHAYKSFFEITMLITVLIVVGSFISMIMIMKIFPKKN